MGRLQKSSRKKRRAACRLLTGASLLPPWLQAALQEARAPAAGSPWGLLQCACFPALWAAWLSDTEAVSIRLLLCLRPRGQEKLGVGPSAEPAGGGWDKTAATFSAPPPRPPSPNPPPPSRQESRGCCHQAWHPLPAEHQQTHLVLSTDQRPGRVPLRPACAWASGVEEAPQAMGARVHNAICQRLQNLGLNTSPDEDCDTQGLLCGGGGARARLGSSASSWKLSVPRSEQPALYTHPSSPCILVPHAPSSRCSGGGRAVQVVLEAGGVWLRGVLAQRHRALGGVCVLGSLLPHPEEPPQCWPGLIRLIPWVPWPVS